MPVFGSNDSKLNKIIQDIERVLSILEALVNFVKRLVKGLCGVSIALLILGFAVHLITVAYKG